jgi:hypothetical protein
MFRDAEARLHMAQETIRMMREQSCVQVAVKKEVRDGMWSKNLRILGKAWEQSLVVPSTSGFSRFPGRQFTRVNSRRVTMSPSARRRRRARLHGASITMSRVPDDTLQCHSSSSAALRWSLGLLMSASNRSRPGPGSRRRTASSFRLNCK